MSEAAQPRKERFKIKVPTTARFVRHSSQSRTFKRFTHRSAAPGQKVARTWFDQNITKDIYTRLLSELKSQDVGGERETFSKRVSVNIRTDFLLHSLRSPQKTITLKFRMVAQRSVSPEFATCPQIESWTSC